MNNLKALVLAGGRGRRLNELNENTKEVNKCMLKFGGKYIIEYSFENAIKASVSEIVVVVGHLAESIINHFGNSYKNIPIKYVIQREQKGLVHAMESSMETIGGSDFILFLGDEFFLNLDIKELVSDFYQPSVIAVCGVIKVADKSKISKTYSILFDEPTRTIYRLVEKPTNPFNNYMGTGNVIFKNSILDHIKVTPINQKRGEKELPDLIQCAIDDGNIVRFFHIGSEYVNVNAPDDLLVIKEMAGKLNNYISDAEKVHSSHNPNN